MTAIHTYSRYESNACMDREDANALSEHLLALATALSARRGRIDFETAPHEIALHYARLVRVVQRATQPNVMGRAAAPGVEKLMQIIENGVISFIVRTPQADIVVDMGRRIMTLEPRGADQRVVPIMPYLEKRA